MTPFRTTSCAAMGCAAFLVASASASTTISAVANSKYTPQQLLDLATPSSQDLQNGDFLIARNIASPSITGDGWDETTTWSFDFTSDPNYAAFAADSGHLTSATLTLTLTTWYPNGPITDVTRPVDLFPQFGIPQFLTNAGTGDITFNLLDNYSSATLLNYLSTNAGHGPMIYADDAVVDHAVMTLTIPEPASVLLACGLFLPVIRRWRRR